MSILRDPAAMMERDPAGMHAHMQSFPNHLLQALEIATSAPLSAKGEAVSSVVVLGMGGSAIGGDLVSGLVDEELSVPFRVVRGYKLPGFVGRDTLVLVSSYSGNTEETLSAYAQASERGGRIVCSTSNGEVARLASERGHDVITIPGGLPPRAALAFSLVPTLVVLWRLGLAADPRADVDEAVGIARQNVDRYGLGVAPDANDAKEIAVWLHHHIPVVYGSVPRMSVVATRWGGQFSENSKTIAHVNELPEMNHNEIVGWSGPEPLGGKAAVVFLRDTEDGERVSRRFDITKSEVLASGAVARDVESVGTSRLARLLSVVGLGDFVSLYLAYLRGVDPTPVAPIDRLKHGLSGE